MLILFLLCLVVGILIGALANATFPRADWRAARPSVILVVGAVSALLGGLLSTLLLGRYFAIATAIWLAIVGVIAIPWLMNKVSRRYTASK